MYQSSLWSATTRPLPSAAPFVATSCAINSTACLALSQLPNTAVVIIASVIPIGFVVSVPSKYGSTPNTSSFALAETVISAIKPFSLKPVSSKLPYSGVVSLTDV